MLVVVGDVAGHGFSSALGMATTSTHLRSFAEHHSDVAVILQHTNAILCKETEDDALVRAVSPLLGILPHAASVTSMRDILLVLCCGGIQVS